jgi:hypothetical protein
VFLTTCTFLFVSAPVLNTGTPFGSASSVRISSSVITSSSIASASRWVWSVEMSCSARLIALFKASWRSRRRLMTE